MKKIYIAGKVTGEPVEICVRKFAEAQKVIQNLGFEAINPLEVVGNWQTPWDVAMKKCLHALIDCEGVVLLEDWKDSKGATIERQLAEDLDIAIFNYSTFGLKILKAKL